MVHEENASIADRAMMSPYWFYVVALCAFLGPALLKLSDCFISIPQQFLNIF